MSLIAYLEALALVRARAARRALGRETVALAEACGRVAAEPLVSTELVPPFANSAVDGFAVRAAELARGLRRLRGLGTIVAGDAPIGARGVEDAPIGARGVEDAPIGARDVDDAGTCWEIMTGAPMPAGYDAAVKIEDVTVRRQAGGAFEIELPAAFAPGEYVREAGEDFRPGMPIVRAGERLRPEHVLACASLGFERVAVRARPKVIVVSTGRELAAPGEVPRPGSIRNSSAPYLLAQLAELGVDARYAGCIADEPREFIALFRRMLENERPDVVITTGAVSMGRHDFIPGALRDLGAEIVFHKVAMRPGKPLLFADFRADFSIDASTALPEASSDGGPVVFALPGNPVSTAVGTRFFVEPYLRALQGMPEEASSHARLAEPASKPENVRVFLKATISTGAVREARALPGQASFMVSPLLEANGWIALREGRSDWAAGDVVEFYALRSQGGCANAQ